MSRKPQKIRPMTRRRFLVNAALTMTNATPLLTGNGLVAQWHLRSVAQGAYDSVRGVTDPIIARSTEREWPAGPTGRALRLDGYSNWIVRNAGNAPTLTASFTLELWVALETYPVTDAPFVNQHTGASAGWFFGLNTVGRWGLSLAAGGNWQQCFAPGPFPKNAWVHIAATYEAHKGMVIYLNGTPQNQITFSAPLNLTAAPTADLVIGRHNLTPYADAGVFPTGALNGIIAEVGIYNNALTREQIHALYIQPGKVGHPDFSIPAQRFAQDTQRPTYHAMPAAAWTNEPHGILQWNDKFHIFFQQNANGPYWGQLHWGHLSSADLVNWEAHPPILAPEAGSDQAGCWSGTALEYKGVPTILYTGVDGVKASISLAQSSGDLTTWTKYSKNPVIPAAPSGLNLMDFRDPFTWVEGSALYTIIGTGIQNQGGAVLLYRSYDLKNWTFVKVLLFRCSPDRQEETLLIYDIQAQQITIDRSRSSANPAVDHGISSGPFASKAGEQTEIHLFLDRSMIDVFLNGRAAFTSRIYPTRGDSEQIGISCTGKAILKTLDIWRLMPAVL